MKKIIRATRKNKLPDITDDINQEIKNIILKNMQYLVAITSNDKKYFELIQPIQNAIDCIDSISIRTGEYDPIDLAILEISDAIYAAYYLTDERRDQILRQLRLTKILLLALREGSEETASD